MKGMDIRMKEKTSGQIIKYVFAVMLVCVFGYFILGEILLPADDLGGKGSAEKYSGAWERVLPNGERVPQEIPGKCDAKKDEIVIVETKLPDDIPEDMYLSFGSAKQEMEIYVDGELRGSYSTKDTRLFGKISAAAYIFCRIYPEDAGKVLRLTNHTDSLYTGLFYNVYIGNRSEIWKLYISKNGKGLCVSFVILLLSIISLIGSVVFRLYYKRKTNLYYLSWGVFIAGIWLIANSFLRQLICPNLSVINDIAFLMILLLPLPFLIYMNEVQKERYVKGYRIAEIIAVVNFILYDTLHMAKIRDFTDTIRYIAISCVLMILYITITLIIDIKKGLIKEYTFVALGIFSCLFFAVLQFVSYFQRSDLFNGTNIAVGLIFLLVFAIMDVIHEIVAMEGQKQKALSASEAKGRFLANMSHEIRTPINAVLGMDAMILRESSEEKIREYALDIQKAGQILLSLINDVLDFSKIESGKMEILPVKYDISSLLHDVINMVSMKAEGKNLAFHVYVDDNLPSKLFGDDIRLRQILVNLLNNAVKYTEKGSVTLSVNGTVKEDDLLLHFEVRDTGIGIKEEDISKLFQEFERIEESRNRNVEGTGLGMSITVKLLQLMESKLRVKSIYGEGSTFYFDVKQGIVDTEPIGNLEERIRNQAAGYSYQVSFTAPDVDILIVDDNAFNRKVFRKLLKATKVRIDEATGGLSCLEMTSKKYYDIIFLDHMMPDLDGIETFHRLKEAKDNPCKDTPVIILTANAIVGAKEMYLAEGFHDYLAKPIQPKKLEDMVLACIPEEKISKEEIPISMGEKQEELPEIDGIDWQYALLHMNEVELLKDTIHNFYLMAAGEGQSLEELWQVLSESDIEKEDGKEACRQYRVKVHSMKSSAALIGAVPLSGVAKCLEYAARDEKTDIINRVHPVFIDEWNEMKEKLGVIFKDEPEEKLAPDYIMIQEYLHLLKPAMEEMDIDTADEISRQLKRYQYPEDMIQVVEMLCMGIKNINIEDVLKYANQLETLICRL